MRKAEKKNKPLEWSAETRSHISKISAQFSEVQVSAVTFSTISSYGDVASPNIGITPKLLKYEQLNMKKKTYKNGIFEEIVKNN